MFYLDFEKIEYFQNKGNEQITALIWNYIGILSDDSINQSSFSFQLALSTLKNAEILKENNDILLDRDLVIELENKVQSLNWDINSIELDELDYIIVATIPNELMDKWNNYPIYYQKNLINLYKTKEFEKDYDIKLFWEKIIN